MSYSHTVDKNCKNITVLIICNFNLHKITDLAAKFFEAILDELFAVSVEKYLQSVWSSLALTGFVICKP